MFTMYEIASLRGCSYYQVRLAVECGKLTRVAHGPRGGRIRIADDEKLAAFLGRSEVLRSDITRMHEDMSRRREKWQAYNYSRYSEDAR